MSRFRSVPALATALAGPALVFGVAATGLGGEQRGPPTDAVAAADAKLRDAPPDVVVVGNSKVWTDIDGPSLGRALGGLEVARLQVPASSAPAWYALLEKRVFEAGHRPKLVVVYGPLAGMLSVSQGSARDRELMEDQLTTGSDVLQRKVGASGGFASRMRVGASRAHTALLEGIRDRAVGLAIARSGESGREVATTALHTLFGELETNARQRVIPVAERSESRASIFDSEASLIPDLVALAEAHGSRIVFVRAPLAASIGWQDAVPGDAERAALARVNELGAGWIDLRTIPLPDGAFRDQLHLTASGRAAVTDSVAERLVDAAVLEGGSLPPARMPLTPASVRREGTSPVPRVGDEVRGSRECLWAVPLPEWEFLADDRLSVAGFPRASPVEILDGGRALAMHAASQDLGSTCSGLAAHVRSVVRASPASDRAPDFSVRLAPGAPIRDATGADAWWVYPGTSLLLEFREPWTGTVRSTIRVLGAGAPLLSAGGVVAPFVARGRVASAELPLASTSAWEVRFEATDAWLFVDRLTVGDIDVIGGPRPAVNVLVGAVEWSAEPREVTLPEPRVEAGLARIALPSLAHVDDDTTRERSGRACAPIRLGTGGPEITWNDQGHRRVSQVRAGEPAWTFTAGTILAAAGGGFVAGLDPRRRCGAATWLHPGDTGTFRPPGAQLRRLALGADLLVFEGLGFSPSGGDVAVGVSVVEREGGARLFSGEVMFPGAGPAAERRLAIVPALPRRGLVDVTLSRADDGGFVVLKSVLLRELEE